MKFSTITKRRDLFNLNLCSAFESACYSVFYDETILFDNEIYLHNETNLFWEKFHCDIRILYSCFFAVPQGAKSGDPYPQWNCSFAPEIWKALWHKGFCKRKKHDSCNTNGIITIVLIWSEWRDLNSRHSAPKEFGSTGFCLFLGISAPFRSETHPFRHSYLHCFRVLRACLWDKLWSSKTPRIRYLTYSGSFLYYSSLALFKFHVARKSGLTTTSPVERSLYSPWRALLVELRSGGKVKSVPSFCLMRMMVSFASVTVP